MLTGAFLRDIPLADLRDRLERLTDTKNSKHFTVEDKNQFLAMGVAETWDVIINTGLAEQYVKKVPFTAIQGQLEYTIDGDDGIVKDDDFYKIHAIYVNEGNGHLRPVDRANFAEITYFQPPTSNVPVVFYYIPSAPTFKDEDENWDDEATFNGINGWEEHSILTAALHMRLKDDKSNNEWLRRKLELERRIQSVATTDWSGPSRVVKRWRRNRWDPYLPFILNVTAWSLRGGKLELYANNTGVGVYL